MTFEDKNDETEVDNDESSDEEVQPTGSSIPGPVVWAISISRDSRYLHIVGSCHRKPNEHYFNWLETKPGVKEEHLKKSCKKCFPLGYPLYSADQPEEVDATLADGMPVEAAIEDGDSAEE